MIACRPARIRPCHAVATVAVCVAAFAFTAPARAQAPPNRGGGLLPTREKPTISGGPNRDEILRRFDLDSDGKIDEAEADAARARMRRDKIEGMSNSGIDPLTGRPRNAGVAGEPAAEPATDDGLVFPPSTPAAPPPRPPAAKAERKPAAPKQQLNAGRPRQPQMPSGPARVRGGMQPAGGSPTQRAAAPRPSLFPQGSAQPTAEDFGR